MNRLLGRFMGEVGKIVDEGTPLQVADGAFAGIAPMPPFFLLSMVGPAVALHNNETLAGAFPDRFYLSPNLQRFVAAGKTSVYAPDFSIPEDVAEIFAAPENPVVLTKDAGARARCSRPWPRKPGSCSTTASSRHRRTSTWP